jgi:hypothetical protein
MPMRSLVWTTTAIVALLGAASAQDAAPAAAPAAGGGEVRDAMNAYAAYQNDVSELRTLRVGNANELEAVIDRLGRHNRTALTRGWVAYGATTAAQSPAFVQGVRDAAAYYGRDAVIWAVTVDPSYARGLRGGQEATRMLLNSANADSARIVEVAERYRELSYSLQRQRWANAVAPQQGARLQRVRTLAQQGAPASAVPTAYAPRLDAAILSTSPSQDPTALGGRRFWDALSANGAEVTQVATTPANIEWRVNNTRGEALDRMAAVAALQALDAGATHQSAISTLLTDPRSRNCLEMSQLQLFQCMSAARFRYENTFCLAQHGLRDVGQCIGDVAQPGATAALAPTGTTGRP